MSNIAGQTVVRLKDFAFADVGNQVFQCPEFDCGQLAMVSNVGHRKPKALRRPLTFRSIESLAAVGAWPWREWLRVL